MGYILLLVWLAAHWKEGHKEPFAATIANNEEDKDDDGSGNDLKSKMMILLFCKSLLYSLLAAGVCEN